MIFMYKCCANINISALHWCHSCSIGDFSRPQELIYHVLHLASVMAMDTENVLNISVVKSRYLA